MAFGDYILNLIKKVGEQEVEERTLCPVCDYPLDKMGDGTLHCQWCGWSSRPKLSRGVRLNG